MGLFDMFKKAEKKPAAAENKEHASTPESEQEISLLGGQILAKKEKGEYVLYRPDGKKAKIEFQAGVYEKSRRPIYKVDSFSSSWKGVEDAGDGNHLIVETSFGKSLLSRTVLGVEAADLRNYKSVYADIKKFERKQFRRTDNGELIEGFFAAAQDQDTKYWGYINSQGEWLPESTLKELY